jgi:hypothetical protein
VPVQKSHRASNYIHLHKQTSYVTKIDAQGKILEQRNLRNDPDTLRGYLTRQTPDTRFAVEATGNWIYLDELDLQRSRCAAPDGDLPAVYARTV